MNRIGVFVCWCGLNIAGTIDVKRVAEAALEFPGVVFAQDYKYVCSDPGQSIIRQAIKEHNLNGLIIAACSPNMHETTFRLNAASMGMNPFRVECANIREQISWPHAKEKDKATEKAIEIVHSIVEKVRSDEELTPIKVPVTKKALVVGGGIAGMQSALEIAEGGYEVLLVEKLPHIGGRMAELGETFPTLDCASCILTPKTAEVKRHPKIKLLTYSEVVEVSGYVGNFNIKIKQKPTFVNWDTCTGCMECMNKCPSKIPNFLDRGMDIDEKRGRAIMVAFPQAIPYRPVLYPESCRRYTKGKCGVCEKVCPTGSINYDMQETLIEEQVGAIVVASGYDILGKDEIAEYGYGKIPDVIDGLQLERLISASGPTAGVIQRPSDGKIPKEVVFIQCVGSRDPANGRPYCSKICCMYTSKHAQMYKHKVHDGQAYIFYMDIRAAGKGYEEFVQRGVEEHGNLYIRGRVSKVFQDGDKVVVWGVDTLSGKKIEIAADMVVLAMAITPNKSARELAQVLKVNTDEYGFFSEAHPKLKPVETLSRGIYLSGAAQAPKDIPDTVSQAGSAASKVLQLFAGELFHPPTIVKVDLDVCKGCGLCVEICPYGARYIDERTKKARIRDVLCQGCGACAAACPSGATQLKNMSKPQLLDMIDAVM